MFGQKIDPLPWSWELGVHWIWSQFIQLTYQWQHRDKVITTLYISVKESRNKCYSAKIFHSECKHNWSGQKTVSNRLIQLTTIRIVISTELWRLYHFSCFSPQNKSEITQLWINGTMSFIEFSYWLSVAASGFCNFLLSSQRCANYFLIRQQCLPIQ